MYIIIAGGGIVGRSMTSLLVEKHDVVVIDQDHRVCEKIYAEYGAVTINGDATQIDVLRQAGIEKCDAALSAMRLDSDNLVFALLAKNFNTDKILVRMREPEYESAYRLAGVTTIGSATDILVNKFYIDIEQPDIRRVTSISGGKAEVSIVTIPENSHIAGRTISHIVQNDMFPDDCVIAGIFDPDNEELIIPRGSQKLHPENQVFLVASTENIRMAADYLMQS
ncbi:MAG: potassium channel family protein [Bacillota bacterium]